MWRGVFGVLSSLFYLTKMLLQSAKSQFFSRLRRAILPYKMLLQSAKSKKIAPAARYFTVDNALTKCQIPAPEARKKLGFDIL